MANFDLVNLALKATCPNNRIMLDDKGLPSVMVWVPKATYAELGLTGSGTHPAFIVNGTEIPGFWASKFQNVVYDGRAYSLPCEDPKHTINFETAAAACTAKGAGWHLMTNAEWSALALWCKKNNLMPKGNNNFGKDITETEYKAIPAAYDTSNPPKVTRVLSGTGPKTWSHNGDFDGIWDLNGNVWEWVGGLRLVYGELQVLVNNNAADGGNSQLAGSAQWKAIKGSDGTFIDPDGSGTTTGAIRLDYVSNAWKWITGAITSQSDTSRNCGFAATAYDSAAIGADAVSILKALGVLPIASSGLGDDIFWANNGAAERVAERGGHWTDGAGYGVFALNLNDPRTNADDYFGFRSAFCELPTE